MGYSQGVAQPPQINNYAPQQIINNNLIIPNFSFDKKFIDSLISQNQGPNDINKDNSNNAYLNFFKNYESSFKELQNQSLSNNHNNNQNDLINSSVVNASNKSDVSFNSSKSLSQVVLNDDYKVEPIYNTNKLHDPNFICFTYYKIKNVICKVIEFFNEKKIVDCDFCLIKINFLENLIGKETFIFKSIIQVFENLKIDPPTGIFLNYENKRYHIYFKLKNSDQISGVTNKFIQFINNLNKKIKFSKDVDFKIIKREESKLEKATINLVNDPSMLANQVELPIKKKLSKIDLFIPTNKVNESITFNKIKSLNSPEEKKKIKSPLKNYEFKRPINIIKPVYNLDINENESTGSITINKNHIRSSKGTEYFTIDNNLVSRLETKYKVKPSRKQNLVGFFFNFYDPLLDSDLKSFFLAGLNKNTTIDDVKNYLTNTLHYDVKSIIRNNLEENTILRVIIANRDKKNPIKINFLEPKIDNRNIIILDIEKECNPESLYVNHQVLITNIPAINNKSELFDFISHKYGNVCELAFNEDATSAIVSFQKATNARNCIQMKSDFFYNTTIELSKCKNPLPLSGQSISQFNQKDSILLPGRPPLIVINKKIWKDFKLEKNNKEKVEVQDFVSNLKRICDVMLNDIDNILFIDNINDINNSNNISVFNSFEEIFTSNSNSNNSINKNNYNDLTNKLNNANSKSFKVFINETSNQKYDMNKIDDFLKRKRKKEKKERLERKI